MDCCGLCRERESSSIALQSWLEHLKLQCPLLESLGDQGVRCLGVVGGARYGHQPVGRAFDELTPEWAQMERKGKRE